MISRPLRILGLTALAALTLPLAACAGASPAVDTTLDYASGESEPDCLDPHVGGNWPQALIGHQFLESLFSRDEQGQVIPWLATGSEVSPDGLTVTVTLNTGVSFSDGTPFDADAVVANMNHLRDPGTKSSTGILALGKVNEIVATSPTTVEFRMNEPDSALTASLAQTWLAIESPAGLNRGTEANCQAPIGTGAFKVESWTRQDRVVLVRNETHVATLASEQTPPTGERIERIEWRFIPDAAARLAALQAGQVEVIDQVEPTALAQLQQNDSFQVVMGARPGTTARLELNTTRAPFNDEKVREAFTRALNVDAGVQSLFAGTLQRSTSPLASSLPEAASFPDQLRYDPAEANRLLDEAGWTERDAAGIRTKDGQPLTVHIPLSTNQSIPAEISLVEQLGANAKDVGFDVQIELLDISSWYARSGTWSFDAIIAPYSKDSADVLRIVYDSAGNVPAPSGYHANNTGVADPQLDALLRTAGQTFDQAERTQLYAQAQQMIIDGHYIIPLYDQMVQFAATAKLHGFTLQPNLNLPTFTNATIGG